MRLAAHFSEPLMSQMPPPFIILSLPRSRSAWLSAFLSYPPKRCGHDLAAESSSIPDFLCRIAKVDGTCETGAVIGWPLIRKFIPQARIVVIKRPVADIEQSLAHFGVVPVCGELDERRQMLDACATQPDVASFDFADLDDRDVCAWIFETCLELPFDRGWYKRLAGQNIQVNVPAQMERLRARQDALTKFKRDVAARIAEMQQGEPCALV